MQDDPQTLLSIYERMVTVRRFESTAGELFAANRIPGFIHLSIGHEASSVGVCSVLRPDDYVTSTHRGHGHLIAKGADPDKMFAELMARETGYCRGRGGSMHIVDFSIGILGANGIVGGGLPIAAGAGLSIKLSQSDQVVVCFFGDGASNRGTAHEAMNMASIWKLPVIFCLEHNQYASTTASSYSCSVEDLCLRAAGYNIPGLKVDGNDVLAVRQAAAEAVSRARAGQGPTFLENKTFRVTAHHQGDPQKYRDPADVEPWKGERDPINRFEKVLLKKKILTKRKRQEIWDAVEARIQAAVRFADESPFPSPEEALDYVWAD